MILKGIALIFIGLAGGLAVGSGFVAFITVLDIIPRLAQMSKTEEKICTYRKCADHRGPRLDLDRLF